MALKAYEDTRLPRNQQRDRGAEPHRAAERDLVDTVEQRTGGKRFDRLENVITL